MQPDKRKECGCHEECTVTQHECESPCTWPKCLTPAEEGQLIKETMEGLF